jgi:hypothetical protein
MFFMREVQQGGGTRVVQGRKREGEGAEARPHAHEDGPLAAELRRVVRNRRSCVRQGGFRQDDKMSTRSIRRMYIGRRDPPERHRRPRRWLRVGPHSSCRSRSRSDTALVPHSRLKGHPEPRSGNRRAAASMLRIVKTDSDPALSRRAARGDVPRGSG